MAQQPGPRQVFPSNIVKIQFASVGGLLFFRVKQTWLGIVSGPSASAEVSGLPWGGFDIFTARDTRDPKNKDKKVVQIADPLTNDMLAQYLYWPLKNPVNQNKTRTDHEASTWIIDSANWWGIIDLHYNGQISSNLPREEARIQLYTGWFAAFGFPPTIDDFGVGLGQYFDPVLGLQDIPGPPDPAFFKIAAEATPPWHYHEEPGKAVTTFTESHTAIVFINLAKLAVDIPKTPDGKTPTDFTFRVDIPANDGSLGTLNWGLEGMVDSTNVSKPPKPDDGRRTFPLADEHHGDVTDNLVPQWSSAGASASSSNPHAGSYVEVKVTFGAAKVKPKIEMTLHGDSGGHST